jgi:hypothetical protein
MADLIQINRYVVSATASQVIDAGTAGQITGTIDSAVPNLLGNELIRVELINGGLSEVTNVATVQTAFVQSEGHANGVTLAQPAFSGSALSIANEAVFESSQRYHAEDIGVGQNVDVNFAVVVNNPGASNVTVTMSFTIAVIRRLYNQPVYDE